MWKCRNGHVLTPTLVREMKDGSRRCVICLRAKARRYVARLRQRKREEGECLQTGCRNDARPGRVYCEDHRTRESRYIWR